MDAEQILLDENFKIWTSSDEEKESSDKENDLVGEGNTSSDKMNKSYDKLSTFSDEKNTFSDEEKESSCKRNESSDEGNTSSDEMSEFSDEMSIFSDEKNTCSDEEKESSDKGNEPPDEGNTSSDEMNKFYDEMSTFSDEKNTSSNEEKEISDKRNKSSNEESTSSDKINKSSDKKNTSSDETNESSDEETESSSELEDLPGIGWELENEDLSGICYSECFFIGEKENVFYLELCPKEKGSTGIALWQLRGKPLKSFCLVFGLLYKQKPKFFIYQNNITKKNITGRPRKLNIHGLYDIRDIKTNGLQQIACLAVYVEEFDETESDNEYSEDKSDEEYYEDESDNECYEEDSDDNKDEEGNENEKGRSSKNFIRKSQRVIAEESASIKTKGEIALIENLKDLFLNDEDSDLIFRVGDQTYPAHKAIIKARSPVFHSMLTHDMVEKNQGVVRIKDCDPYMFRSFLHYLYIGKLDNITSENVFELHHMSDKYDIKELKTECIDFIQNNFTVDNICDAISLATIHNEQVLLTHATKFFIDNIKDILTTINWQKFVEENPIKANELFIKTVHKGKYK